jgi:hypothetical protein
MAQTATATNGVTLDDDDRVRPYHSLLKSLQTHLNSQEIEEMRRQVLEMEQDLARDTEAVGIAALTGAAASLSPADAAAKNSGNAVDGLAPDPSDPSSAIDPSGSADPANGDDPDGRSIYVGNVTFLLVRTSLFQLTCLYRSTMVLLQKRFRLTLPPVGPSTVSLFYSTSSRVIPKGRSLLLRRDIHSADLSSVTPTLNLLNQHTWTLLSYYMNHSFVGG